MSSCTTRSGTGDLLFRLARGHATIEGQVSGKGEDPVETSLIALKREGNRSWAMLGRGCLDLLGKPMSSNSPAGAASARTFARKAAEISRLSYTQLLSWLEEKGYYRSPSGAPRG